MGRGRLDRDGARVDWEERQRVGKAGGRGGFALCALQVGGLSLRVRFSDKRCKKVNNYCVDRQGRRGGRSGGVDRLLRLHGVADEVVLQNVSEMGATRSQHAVEKSEGHGARGLCFTRGTCLRESRHGRNSGRTRRAGRTRGGGDQEHGDADLQEDPDDDGDVAVSGRWTEGWGSVRGNLASQKDKERHKWASGVGVRGREQPRRMSVEELGAPWSAGLAPRPRDGRVGRPLVWHEETGTLR